MVKLSAVRGHGRVASVPEGVALPLPTRYDRGDRTRGRARVPEGEGQGQGRTLFTTAEAAAMLGIAHETVKAQIRLGQLAVERINPRLNMVTAEAIEEYRLTHLRRRGRPKGAKNKPKAATIAPADDPSAAGEERDQ